MLHPRNLVSLAVGSALVMTVGWQMTRVQLACAQQAGAADGRKVFAGKYVELRIRSLKEHYCRVEAIAVECELINGSADSQITYPFNYGPYFDPHSDLLALHINVTHGGKKAALTRFGAGGGLASSGSFRGLPPGAKMARRTTVNSIYDMTLGGEYRITASMPVQGPLEKGGKNVGGLVKSNEIKVSVDGDCPQ